MTVVNFNYSKTGLIFPLNYLNKGLIGNMELNRKEDMAELNALVKDIRMYNDREKELDIISNIKDWF